VAEKLGESVKPELLAIQTQLAKLRIENWLAFFSFLLTKLTKIQKIETIGRDDQSSDAAIDQRPDSVSKSSQSDGAPGSIKR